MARGHGWSKRGSKASRRAQRKSRRRQWFYVVVCGWRRGIFFKWKNAKAQVEGYSNNKHAEFRNLAEAQQFLTDNIESPLGVTTPFPPHMNTPLPPAELNPCHRDLRAEPEPEDLPDLVHVDYEVQIPPHIAVGPAVVSPEAFRRVRELSEVIVNVTANRVLDPASFECSNPTCGFCSGDHMAQRHVCMKRLCQLNAQLMVTDGAGVTRPGQESSRAFFE